MKNFYYFFMLMFCVLTHSQIPVTAANVKMGSQQYIMCGKPSMIKVDTGGNSVEGQNSITADLNSIFTIITKFTDVGGKVYYQIKIKEYPVSADQTGEKRILFNEILPSSVLNKQYDYIAQVKPGQSATDDDDIPKHNDRYKKNKSIAYFLIAEDDIYKHTIFYNPEPNWEFSFGTISYLSRIRGRVGEIKAKWSTDLSLGLAAGIKYNLTPNSSISALGGIAISRVVLDSISTRGTTLTSIEKPSLVPNINLMYTYKIFSVGAGIGWDLVNEDTPESKAWIYNRRMFYGICFGINIFQNHSDQSSPTGAQDQ